MLPNEAFALACRAYYDEVGLIVDERNGEFAHCPYPEGMGETGYYLLHDHHQHQGILQSKDVGRICFFTSDARKWLTSCDYWPDNYFELWDTYEEYARKNGYITGTNHKVNRTGIFDPSYLNSKRCKEDCKRRGKVTFSRGEGCFKPGKQSKGGVTSGNAHAVNKTGVCGQSSEKMTQNGIKGGSISGPITVSNKTGIYSPSWRESEEYFAHQREIALTKWYDPDHPELGEHNAGVLVRKQKKLGYPYGKENRVKVG
jgi:hypothetical protein